MTNLRIVLLIPTSRGEAQASRLLSNWPGSVVIGKPAHSSEMTDAVLTGAGKDVSLVTVHGGYASIRNQLLDEATHRGFTHALFVDDDVTLHEHAYALMVQAVENEPQAMVGGHIERRIASGGKFARKVLQSGGGQADSSEPEYLSSAFICLPAIGTQYAPRFAECLDWTGCEDTELTSRFRRSGARLVQIDDPLGWESYGKGRDGRLGLVRRVVCNHAVLQILKRRNQGLLDVRRDEAPVELASLAYTVVCQVLAVVSQGAPTVALQFAKLFGKILGLCRLLPTRLNDAGVYMLRGV